MGHKTHSKRRAIPKFQWTPPLGSYNSPRTQDLWFYPNDIGKKELHIQAPVNVESGLSTFLKARLGGTIVTERIIIDRFRDQVLLLKKGHKRFDVLPRDKQLTYDRHNEVPIGTFVNNPKDHIEPESVEWKMHQPRRKEAVYRLGL